VVNLKGKKMLYSHFDATAEDSVKITFERVTLCDDCLDEPQERDEGISEERVQDS
jgi:hypothetical protein